MSKTARYLISGISASVTNFVIYEVLVIVVFHDVSLAWLATGIASLCATVVAFILHSRLTWRDRDPGKYGPLKFLLWNIFMSVAVGPLLAFGFEKLTGLYEWAYGICQWLHLPFSYDLVVSLGIYGLSAVVTMTMNFFIYERIIFREKKEEGEDKKVKGVGKAGKEVQGK